MVKSRKTVDMTVGKPIKTILIFAIPLFIGNIFQQIYNVVDTMIAGHNIGDQAISAIGATSSLYSLIVNLAFGMNTGYSVIMSRFFGNHDDKNLKKSIALSIGFNIIIGIVLTIISVLFLKPLMRLIKVPENIFDDAYKYLIIIVWFMLATIVYNMFASILRALGNSRVPLYFLIFSCTVNLIGDIVLVKNYGMGVDGLALSTVISQTLSAILVTGYFFTKYKEYIPKKEDFEFDKGLIKELSTLGLSYVMLNCVVTLGSVFFQGAINSLGDKSIAAWTTSRKAIGALMQPLSCLANALSTFIAQNYGAKKYDRIKYSFKRIILIEMIMSLVWIILGFIGGKETIRLISGTQDSEILKNGYISIICHFVMYPPLALIFCIRNGMQAMGHKIVPVISSVGELIIKIIVTYFVIPYIGFIGVCLTEPIIWLVFGIYLLIAYLIEYKKNMIYPDKKAA